MFKFYIFIINNVGFLLRNRLTIHGLFEKLSLEYWWKFLEILIY